MQKNLMTNCVNVVPCRWGHYVHLLVTTKQRHNEKINSTLFRFL